MGCEYLPPDAQDDEAGRISKRVLFFPLPSPYASLEICISDILLLGGTPSGRGLLP